MYNIKVFNKPQDIYNLKSDWNRLYENNLTLSHSQSFDWNIGLIANKLYIGDIQVYCLYKNDQLVLISPFQYYKRQLSFIGSNDTHADYLNFIYDKSLSYSDYEYFIKHLIKLNKFTVIKLSQVNQRTKTCDFQKVLGSQFKVNTQECGNIILLNDSKLYFNNLSSNTKKSIRSRSNKSKKNFNCIEVYHYLANNISDDLITSIKTIYKSRVTEITGGFRYTNEYINFFYNYIFSNKDFSISCMYFDNKLVAFEIGALRNGRIEVCINQFDSSYKDYSPGNQLLFNCISHYCDLDKWSYLSEYDLTVGSERYKFDYGCKVHLNYEFFLNYFTQFKLINRLVNNCYACKWVKFVLKRYLG
jgi:hypothetical protein